MLKTYQFILMLTPYIITRLNGKYYCDVTDNDGVFSKWVTFHGTPYGLPSWRSHHNNICLFRRVMI